MSQRPSTSAMAQVSVLINLRRYADAAATLRQVLAGEPDNSHAHCLLAQCLLELPEPPRRALEEAERATALAPETEWPHRLRAIALMRMGKSRKAVDAAREAVRLAPSTPNCYIVLSDALRRSRKLTAAAEAAVKARELAPNSAATHNAVGLVSLAARRNREAENHFRAALARDPENANALNNLGVAALRQGRRSAAIAYFADASRINPHSSLARRNAVGAAGTGTGVIIVAILIVNVVHQASGVAIGALAFLGGLVLISTAKRWFQMSSAPHEPTASKQLIRELRKEARRTGTSSVRWGWLLSVTAIAFLIIVAVFGALVFLNNMASGDIGLFGAMMLVVSIASVAGAVLLSRRARRR